MGGWLRVRGVLRYSLTSAGTIDNDADSHLGQIIEIPRENVARRHKTTELRRYTLIRPAAFLNGNYAYQGASEEEIRNYFESVYGVK